jgi:hypothetical protein
MTQYLPLAPTGIDVHATTMANEIGRSGIYPSGEAHFFDLQQNLIDNPAPSGLSVFDFNLLNSVFSNATESQQYVIDDFTVFNPYIHNSGNYTVNISGLLNLAVDRYNIYSATFRTRPISRTTT